MEISCRPFDFRTEDVRPLFALMERAYDLPVNKDRWRWEYLHNPRSAEIAVFVAEAEGRIVASTARLPLTLKTGSDRRAAFFSVDSVVDPAFRRMGIMSELYRYTARIMPIMYSKGTNPGMYELLMKFGYRVVRPNTYLVNYLAPVKHLLSKLGVYEPPRPLPTTVDSSGEMLPVKRFGEEFDEFWERASRQYEGVVVKDSAYMNWRYLDIPHLEYQAFYRMVGGKVVSALVLRGNGTSGSIVDVLWDGERAEEPSAAIGTAKRVFEKGGGLKLSCWGTHRRLRESLRQNRFRERGAALRFSVYTDPRQVGFFAEGHRLHFVDGDGDSEFCG